MSDNAYTTALKLRTLGYSVIPSGGGKKYKAPLVKWQERQQTPADELQLDQWQTELQPKLWGIVTNDKVAVIEADTPQARTELEAELGQPNVLSPRGGAHWYCDTTGHPLKTIAGLFPDVDVRGVGGFINIAGSSIFGEYQILRLPVPKDLIPYDRLPERIRQAVNGSKSAPQTASLPAGKITEGQRNGTLASHAGSMRRRGMTQEAIEAALLATNQAQCQPPLPDSEVLEIAKSISRYEPAPDGRFVRQDRQNQQETQDKPQEEIQPYNREQYLKVLSQWLYLEDQQDIDIIMATAISICLPGDPIWMFIITAAGGSKTEILRTFSNSRTFSTSTLTPQTLISGLKGGKDIDLMPKLDGKLLIIKDFTSILSKKAEDQAGIFADLREAYDGYLEKSFGSGVETKRYKSSFGVLAAVTDAIDMYRVVHALLGERFLKCRLHTNPKEAIERASSLAGKEVEMRAALTEATNSCMAYYAEKASQYEDIIIEKDTHQKIKALADLTAKLRSEVARDRFHKVLYQPQPEVGTRLAKQLRKLAQALSVFYEHDCIGDAEYNVLLRIAQDTVPKQRMKLVLGMMDAEPLTTKAAGDRAEIPTDTAKEILEDLWMLKLIARTGDSTFYWQLTDSMNYLLLDSGLGTQNTLRTHKNNNNSLG